MPDVVAHYPPLSAAAVDAVVDATVLIAGQRLPGGLSADESARLRTRTTQTLAAAERLHAYPLSNSDEPAFVLGLPGRQP
ncbi:MAG TPA: hypothetical protein VG164_04195 [Trebonia sp.]|jgi:hypothetical protein|nr:hypothetical protein [Trebonia sp.]